MEITMGIIYSAGMSCNRFDVAPAHGRIHVYSEKPKDAGY